VNQRRRHDEELAGDVEIQLLHQLDRLEILRGDQRDRDVVDADFVLPDEMKEQIERSLKLIELDREGIGSGLELHGLSHVALSSEL
jgi:hypothetical protein